MFIKEKIVKRKLFKNEVKLTKQDKDDILNKIIDKTDLEVSEKVSFRKKVNLKVVYALACSLVICVLGYVGYLFANNNMFVDPNYRGKQVELLDLDEDDICLAYRININEESIENLVNKYDINIRYKKNNKSYIIDDGEKIYFVIFFENNIHHKYQISLSMTSELIIQIYNFTYNKSFNKENLNSNKSGLLFEIVENGIEFYTRDNNKKYPIFVEFE